MNEEPAAVGPCPQIAHPLVIDNPPGQSAIRYRVGDYGSFRDALLRSLPDERELLRWRPTAGSDLALQLFEWWAYLADILTFYNEQIANGAYLGTAFLPGAVAQIARLIGYRPLPGIGAHGTLAAIIGGQTKLQLPAGVAVQSKPGPGEQPKVFELGGSSAPALPTSSGGVVPVDVKQATMIRGRTSLLLRSTVTSVTPGDVVVVAGSPPTAANSQAMTIASIRAEKDPRGRTNSRMTFTSSLTVPDGDVTTYRVMRSDAFQVRYPYAPADTAITFPPLDVDIDVLDFDVDGTGPLGPPPPGQDGDESPRLTIHLASVARSIAAGELVLLESALEGALSYTPASVISYTEEIWYANADDTTSAPEDPPTKQDIVPFPVPHSVVELDALTFLPVTRVWFGFRSIADLLDEPAGPTISGTSFAFTPLAGLDPLAALGQAVIIEDATGAGALATLATSPSPDEVQVTTDASVVLTPPLRLLFNLVDVTEGKTVKDEVLGNGDPTAAGQAFVLQKSPLTYLAGNDPSFPTSTLTVVVDAIAWTEVTSFYGQAPDAQVYVTREDADQKTQVLLGDGVNGARLPRGVGNVKASYRVGSGGPAPAAGSIATILKPVAGLAAVRNPVQVTGGDDPTPPTSIRRYAPLSVLTFGRAVAAADYEAIAANAPSVTRARAYFSWDKLRQRATVAVYVGDDEGARAAAQFAIDTARDPNVAATVKLATPIHLNLHFTLACDARFDQDAVRAQVLSALVGDDGLFSPGRIRIGEPLYNSQIYAACLGVAGTLAVRDLVIADNAGSTLADIRHMPGEGRFFTATASDVYPTLEVA